MKSLFNQGAQESEERDHLLNEAMTAFVHTIPSERRLEQFLVKAGLSNQLPEVEASLRLALKATESHLYAQPNGVRWTSEFEEELFEQIRKTCPWLNEVGFRPLKAFGQWLCWHEGLNVRPEA
jgi:hypothetical protein